MFHAISTKRIACSSQITVRRSLELPFNGKIAKTCACNKPKKLVFSCTYLISIKSKNIIKKFIPTERDKNSN